MKKKVFMGLIIVIAMLALQGILGTSIVRAETITGSDGDVSWSFDSESGTLTFSGSGTITENWWSKIDSFDEKVKKVIIEDGIMKIEDHAFDTCNNLKSIDLPNSLEFVDVISLAYCNSLVSVNVSNNNKSYSSVYGVLYNKDKTKLICYPRNKANTNYKILDGVTSIGEGAFFNCKKLNSIEIPNSVAKIDKLAFSYCENLVNIKIPSGVKSIESDTFIGCKNLTHIEIPNSVTSIGEWAFVDCEKLNSIEIPNSVANIGVGAFTSSDNLPKIEILTKIAIPNSVTSIGIRAFDRPNLTIYCKSNSKAQQYAEENKIKYEIDEDVPTITALTQENKYINITATDNNGAGLAKKAYSINGKDWQESNTYTITESGKYKIYVRDALDNIAEKEIEVTLFKENDGYTNKDDSKDNTEDKTDENKNNKQENQNPSKDDTQAPSKIPQTGTISVFSIFIILGIISVISYKKFKKNNY